MRILQLSSVRQFGGGERHLVDLTNGLMQRDHHLCIAVSEDSPLLRELSLPEQDILTLPVRNSLHPTNAWQLRKFMRDRGVEIIHAHAGRDYPLAALAARWSEAHLVLTRHVLFPMSRVHRLTLRRTALVIAVSEAVANSLRAQSNFSPDKVVTIHNGIDVAKFEQSREAAHRDQHTRYRVGTIGHLAAIKGQEDFIRAAALVRKQRDDVDFIIVGEDKSHDGANRARLEQLIRDYELQPQVELVGWIDDVAGLLPTLDLFASTAVSEPFGLAIVEAMACGVPVLATATGGALEIISDGETGRLTPIGHAEELAKRIVELLNDAQQRERLSTNARKMVAERFSLERMVSDTEAAYRKVLSS